MPTSGVFLNMVTKTGGNKWHGSTTFTWTGDSLQARNDHNPDLQKYGFRPDGNTSDFVSDFNVTAGGPLVQNKLRFFGSFRDWRVHQNVPVQNSAVVLDQTNITSGLGNVTWQVNQNNRITGFYSRQRYSKPNRLLNNASITVIDSTSDEEDMFDLVQGLWNTVLGKNFFIDARLGMNKILFPTYQNGGNQQSLTDNATGIVYGNFPTDTVRNRDRYQANATAQYYIDQALGGRHELQFGFDNSHAVIQNENTRVDDVRTFYNSTLTPRSQTVEIYATPLIDRSALDVLALFAQDSYSVKRLTLTGGLRWERLEGYLPEQSSPPSVFYPAIQRSFAGSARRGAVAHGGPARQRGLRRDRRRKDGRQGVVRPLLLRPVDRRRRRQPRQSERQLFHHLHVERRQQRPQVPARRADRRAACSRRARRRRSIRTSAGPTPTSTASASIAS